MFKKFFKKTGVPILIVAVGVVIVLASSTGNQKILKKVCDCGQEILEAYNKGFEDGLAHEAGHPPIHGTPKS